MSSEAAGSTESPTDAVNEAVPNTQSPTEAPSQDTTAAASPTESTNETAPSTQPPSVERPSLDMAYSSPFGAEELQRELAADELRRQQEWEAEQLRKLQQLYVDEKRLRRELRAIRRLRMALTSVIVLCVLFLPFWGLIYRAIVRLNPELTDVIVQVFLFAGYLIPLAGISFSAEQLASSWRGRPVVKANNEIDQIVAERNSILATSHAKTTDYIQRTKLDVAGYQDSARRLRWMNNILQIVVILGSLLAATLAGASSNNSTVRWAAVIAGAFASFAASMISFFKFKERSFSLEQAGSSIETELNSYDLSGGRFRRLEPEEREPELVEAIERVRSDLRQREAALGTESSK